MYFALSESLSDEIKVLNKHVSITVRSRLIWHSWYS